MLDTLGIGINLKGITDLLLDHHDRLTETFNLGEQVLNAICSRVVAKHTTQSTCAAESTVNQMCWQMKTPINRMKQKSERTAIARTKEMYA